MTPIREEAKKYSRERVMGYNASDKEVEERTGEDTKYLLACIAEAYLAGKVSKITATRLEVIDHSESGKGRVYVNHDVESVDISYQDDDRTLKLFIK